MNRMVPPQDELPPVIDDVEPVDDTPVWQTIKREVARLPLLRLLATAMVLAFALVLARFSWALPLSSDGRDWHYPPVAGEPRVTMPIAIDAERALYDWRATRAAPPVEQDRRLLMVAYDQQTMLNTQERSPLDRTIMAKALANLDAMDAKAIGIDILIDQPQADDAPLLATLKAMKTPTFLGYSSRTSVGDQVETQQQEYMDSWHRQLVGSNVYKASVRVGADSDNVLRQWPEKDPDPQAPSIFPIAMTGFDWARGYAGSLLYRKPANPERPVFQTLPIDLFADPATADLMAAEVKDRYVLIGADVPDADRFLTPGTRSSGLTIPGMEGHAVAIAQLLDRRLPGRVEGGMLWLLAALVVVAALFTALLDVRPWVSLAAIAFQLAFFGAVPFMFEQIGMDTYGLPAFGWLAGWVLAYTAASSAAQAVGSDQKKYAQSALGKYLPRDIAVQIMRDPGQLSLKGEKRALFTLFTDIEGFTTLSHLLPPERTANLLNAYLDGMSNIVLGHGGTIDKFVGDAVVAFWGAPIARDDDADRAIAAAVAMNRFTRTFAVPGSNDGAMMGRTRVGLHHGEAVVGNFGGEGRLTYTALGDAMNVAARLEGANKYLKTIALVSDEARQQAVREATIFRPMGRITVPGRATPVVVWEPVPDTPEEERLMLCQWWTRFETGDRTALDELTQFSLTKDKDPALTGLVERLRKVGPGGVYDLKEK